jgi:predicted proteasome-type protease
MPTVYIDDAIDFLSVVHQRQSIAIATGRRLRDESASFLASARSDFLQVVKDALNELDDPAAQEMATDVVADRRP